MKRAPPSYNEMDVFGRNVYKLISITPKRLSYERKNVLLMAIDRGASNKTIVVV
jgi:hypothetical protein